MRSLTKASARRAVSGNKDCVEPNTSAFEQVARPTLTARAPNVRMQRSGWDKVQIEATAAGR
jgi:hypothetical protein